MPLIGAHAATGAFLIADMLHFALLPVLTRRLCKFCLDRLSFGLIGVHLGLRIVIMKVGSHGRLSTRLHAAFAKLHWPIRSMT